MPAKPTPKSYREVRGIRLDQQEWIAYRLSILHGYNARGLAAMYTKLFHLTVPQWRVLTVIGRHAPASASEVAGFTSLEPDKITRAVDSLVKLGFVHRKPDARASSLRTRRADAGSQTHRASRRHQAANLVRRLKHLICSAARLPNRSC